MIRLRPTTAVLGALGVAVIGVISALCGAGNAWAGEPAAAGQAITDCSWVAAASHLLATLNQNTPEGASAGHAAQPDADQVRDPRAERIRSALLALGFSSDGAAPPGCAATAAGRPSPGGTRSSSDGVNSVEPLHGVAERALFTPGTGGRVVHVTAGQSLGEVAAAPGDTVVIPAGTYSAFTPRSGADGRYVTYTAEPGAVVTITDGSSGGGAIDIHGGGWVHLDGLTIADAGGYALQVQGADHVAVTDVVVTGSQDGGMRIADSANIVVSGCDVHGTNARGTSAESEAVSLEKVTGFEVFNNRVHDNGEEGIDIKYGSTDGAVHHNLAAANRGPNIYLDGSYHVDVHHNYVVGATSADKPGIMVAAEAQWWPAGTASDLAIHDNTVWNNPAGSILFWEGQFSGITVTNNIVDKPVETRGGVEAVHNVAGAIPALTGALLGENIPAHPRSSPSSPPPSGSVSPGDGAHTGARTGDDTRDDS